MVCMTKTELRKTYRALRMNLDLKDKIRKDDLLLIQFQNLAFSNVDHLLSYWPMKTTAEPNTHLFTRYLKHMYPSITVSYPVINNANGLFNAVKTNDDTVFRESVYGLTEPVEGEVVDPVKIDLVFVPLLICDKVGNRVGFGKGFYDKFLAQCSSGIIKVGFSYYKPVDKIDDANAFDVPLNFCITPDGIYEF